MVAIRILQQWARLAQASCTNGQNPSPILATSDSNIAVDNLVEGCASVGLKVVRLGRPEAIRPELLRYCIDRPSSSYDKPGGDRNSYYSNSQSPATINYKERMKQLKSAQIVCCTCIGSGGDMLDSLGPLERVLVDEATQATEPAVVVPLMRGCRQLVLVGDHCQVRANTLGTFACFRKACLCHAMLKFPPIFLPASANCPQYNRRRRRARSSFIFTDGCVWRSTLHVRYAVQDAPVHCDVPFRSLLRRTTSKWCHSARAPPVGWIPVAP